MRTRSRILLVALALALPARAAAQPAPSAEASETFRLGREAFDKGDYPRALSLLRRSQKLAPGRGKLANIARCEARLGMFGSARRHFEEVVEKLPEKDELRAAIAVEVAAIKDKVPYLRIALAPGAAGAAVTLDGEPVAAADLDHEIAIDPGKHVVVAEQRYDVSIAVGEHRTVTVGAPAAQPAPTPAEPARSRVSPLAIAGFSVAGAGLLIGSITGGVAFAKASSVKSKCPGGACPESEAGAVTSANTVANVSNATFAIAAAGAVLGVVGLVLPQPKPGSARIEPVVGARWLGVEGTF